MQFPVGSNVVPLFPSGSDAALTLFNNGPSIIYIGSDTALNSNTGFPLAVGSAIVWDKDNPLFIVCAKGYVSTLYAVENSGPSSLGTVALSGSVSLAPGSTVGIADGSHVALAPGSEVALADGATVSLTSGTAVTLESGTAVTLADGSTVNLASGATVDIATGATVGLQSGTAVDLASGASVAVNSLPPDTSKFWPCISGEAYPPTFGTASYSTLAGNPCVTIATTVGTRNAKWNALARYSPNGPTNSLVISGYIYLPTGATGTGQSNAVFLGYWTGAYTSAGSSALYNAVDLPKIINGLRFGALTSGTAQAYSTAFLDVNGANGGSIDISSLGSDAQWLYFEIVFSPTLSRLTINKNTALRTTGPALLDSFLQSSFLFGNPDASKSGGSSANIDTHSLTNLYSTYPSVVPA